jgi:hypothetical protein
MVALAAAVVLILSGSMKFGQLALALAGAAAGCAIVVRGSTQQSSSVAPLPFATLLVGLLATGYLYSYSDVPAASYLLVAVAPLATCVASFAPGSRFNRRRRQLAELIAVAAILGLAVGLALI